MIDDCPKEKVREVPASEILDKILKGEDVEYDCVIVKGDLDLSKLDLPTQHIERTDFQKAIGLSEEAKLVKSEIKIINSKIDGILGFDYTLFQKLINFSESEISGDANFRGAQFSESIDFSESTDFSGLVISGDAHFSGTQFSESAHFSGAQFRGSAFFNVAQFRGDAHFSGAQFSEFAIFSGTQFSEFAIFSGTQFSEFAIFRGAQFDGDLTFRHATFSSLAAQGEACRKTKMVQAKIGNRDEEEYHFYREMEAIRKLNGLFKAESYTKIAQAVKGKPLTSIKEFLWYDVFEYIFVQKIFGYGVHPWWLIGWWIVIVTLFAITYWAGKGIEGAVTLFDYFKVSFATAIAPGYIAVIINPASTGYRIAPSYQAVAILETIVGTFLWAGFIATFAKRYMR